MPLTLSELLASEAQAGEDRFRVTELFHDPTDRRLTHAALDAGGWLQSHEVLVRIDRFGAPTASGWPVDMGAEAVREAPEWENAPHGAFDLPPVVVGPFGMTFSPALIGAALNSSAAERLVPVPPRESDESGPLKGAERASPWIGREVFGASGALGRVRDVELEEMRLSTAVLDDDTRIPLADLRVTPQGHAIRET